MWAWVSTCGHVVVCGCKTGHGQDSGYTKTCFYFFSLEIQKACILLPQVSGVESPTNGLHPRRWPRGGWRQIPGLIAFLPAHPSWPLSPSPDVGRPPGLLCLTESSSAAWGGWHLQLSPESLNGLIPSTRPQDCGERYLLPLSCEPSPVFLD